MYGPGAGNEYNITAACYFGKHLCCRPYHSAGAVPLHRVAYFFACGYAYTTNSRAVSNYIDDQRRIRVYFSSAVAASEITVGI